MTEQHIANIATGYRPMRPSTDVCRWTALDTRMVFYGCGCQNIRVCISMWI